MSLLLAYPGTRFRLLRAGVALMPLSRSRAGRQPVLDGPVIGLSLPIGAEVICVGCYWPPVAKNDGYYACFAWEEHTGELNIWQPAVAGIDAVWAEVVE